MAKKNAGRYSKRKSKKRAKRAVARVLGVSPYAKRPSKNRRARSRKTHEFRNPALKPISRSTGWMKGPAGTQVKFKKNRGKTEVYIRRKPTAKRKTKKGKR